MFTLTLNILAYNAGDVTNYGCSIEIEILFHLSSLFIVLNLQFNAVYEYLHFDHLFECWYINF